MKFAYTNAQMRKMDEDTIKKGTSSRVLMERAGEALARRTAAVMGQQGIGDVLFVCGGGNNGGDGFVAARLLRNEGYDVEVLCMAEKFSPDCAYEMERYGEGVLGIPPRRRYALIVDCLFGTGLTRAPEGKDALLIDFINHSGAYVIACDIPSGLSGAGIAFSPCVVAHETLCVGQWKQGLLLADGADVAGEITVCDIGIDGDERGAEVWEDGDVKAYFPKKKSHTSKGSYGSAAILAGDVYSGAAFLSAGACLKSGAGYTRLCVSRELYPYAVGKLPAVILQPFKGLDDALLHSDCIAVGMGMGVSKELYELTAHLLKEYAGTLVLDADALNALAQYGAEILKEKKCRVVLTPHPKEFSRLCGKSVGEILGSGTNVAQEFSAEYGVTLVLKNNRTIIAEGERCAIVTTGSPALAKGGSGDVLAGFLAGTLARGVKPFEAACCSSYVLGRAGELAAAEMGEYAPDAQDIVNFLPRVLKAL